MKKILTVSILVLAVCSLAAIGFAKETTKEDVGEKLFKKHCAQCHPNGSNIIKPEMALGAKEREAHKLKTADDIVKLMRNPGPGMVKFGEKTIPEKDAKAIAEYILKTFK